MVKILSSEWLPNPKDAQLHSLAYVYSYYAPQMFASVGCLTSGYCHIFTDNFYTDWIHRSQEFSASQWCIRRVSFVFILRYRTWRSLNEGITKVIATTLFIFFGVETLGRKVSLFISAMGMGTLFFIIGAILKTHPPPSPNANVAAPSPPPASQAMAAMLYIYVCFYSMGWGKACDIL